MSLSRFLALGTAALASAALVYVQRCKGRRRRMDEESVVVTSLAIYPIKSCRGIKVDSADITNTGFLNDRRFMVVDAETHDFLTIRQLSSMVLLVPSLTPSTLELRIAKNASVPALAVPLRFTDEQKKKLATYDVTIWGQKVHARDCGDEAAVWLSKYLERPVRLVTYADDYVRPLGENQYYLRYPDRSKIDPSVMAGFADGFPFLVTSEASIAEVTTRVGEPVSMDRFRPNIVVDGCRAFEEDTWSELDIGGEQIFLVKPCSRCTIPLVNPETAEVGKQPINTLLTREFRRLGNKPFFGQNAVQARPGGTLRVGDRVRIRARFNEYRGPVAHDNYPIEPPVKKPKPEDAPKAAS